MTVGSGTDSDATWLSGIDRAVRLDLHRVENGDRRAAGSQPRQFLAHVLDRAVHAFLDFGVQALDVVDIHSCLWLRLQADADGSRGPLDSLLRPLLTLSPVRSVLDRHAVTVVPTGSPRRHGGDCPGSRRL